MKRLLALLLPCLLLFGAARADAPVYSRTVTLHPGAPATTFTVYPDAGEVPQYPGDPAYRLEISRDGAETQTLRFAHLGGDELSPLLSFEDVNMDGYADVSALYAQGAANETRTYFLWDEQQSAFVPCDALAGLSTHMLYPGQRVLFNHLHDSFLAGQDELYCFPDGVPTLYRRFAITQLEPYEDEQYAAVISEFSIDGQETVLLSENFPLTLANEEGWQQKYAEWEARFWQGIDPKEPPISDSLYVNPNGGEHYHANAECTAVSPELWPGMERIDRVMLNEAPYSALTPCEVCTGEHR